MDWYAGSVRHQKRDRHLAVVRITGELTGRFIFFVPLSVVPLCIALLASARRAALCYATTALVLLALVPRLLDVSRGVQASRAGQSALPEQIVLASDCVRRLDARPSWRGGGQRRGYGTVASGTRRLTDLASPRTSPSRTVTGTGGVSLNR
jgi:hypothetical protein